MAYFLYARANPLGRAIPIHNTSKNTMNQDSSLFCLPQHVAIIMDGNRRWAKKHNKHILQGYQKGADTLAKIVRFAAKLGIRCVTVYSFSTENWRRPQEEVDDLMDLFPIYLRKEEETMIEEGVRVKSIGNVEALPEKVQKAFKEVEESTKGGKRLDLVIAVNYGGRNEMIRGMQKMFSDLEEGLLKKSDLTEEMFTKYLDTAEWKDPDLVLRTSGEFRLSNFLLWQVSYAEIRVIDQLWPDLSERDFLEAIRGFQERKKQRTRGLGS